MRSNLASRGLVLGIGLVLVPLGFAARVEHAGTSLNVPATANIFGAGHTTPPAPAGGGAGTLPPVYKLPAGSGRVLDIGSVTGQITCCDTQTPVVDNGPTGRTDFMTSLSGTGGISGVSFKTAVFLAGVFLGSAAPSGNPPTQTDTTTPQLGQVFYAGPGVSITVPDTATRLFLGIADGYSFAGNPGYYGDNSGSFEATISIRVGSSGSTTSVPAASSSSKPSEHSVSITFTRGGSDATVRRGRKTIHLKELSTFVLREGDYLNTGYHGVVIRLATGDDLILDGQTKVKITKLFLSTNTRQLEYYLWGGGISARVHDPTKISTPIAVTGSEGTAFSVRYDPKAHVTTIAVTVHSVLITPTNRKLKPFTLHAGYQVTVTPSKVSPLAKIH